jgi:hypothetical protein
MTILTFNTKNHTLKVSSDYEDIRGDYQNILTIQLSLPNYHFYEVFGEDSDGKRFPVLRLPISNTIIKYEHS